MMKKNVEKSSGIMKVMSVVIMLAFIAPAMVNAQSGKANFSGTWAMNAEKSNFGQGGGQQGGGGGGMRMGGGNMTVKQEANLLTIERTRPGRDGGDPVTTKEVYTLDGKESVNNSGRGESKSTATWSPDGKALTVVTSRTFDMNGESRTMKSTAVWTMEGSNLTVKTTMASPNGDRTTTAVYDKK